MLAALIALAPSAVLAANPVRNDMESFFRALQRPDSPNHWLVAPAAYAVRPDAVAPVFEVPVAVLHAAFRAVIRDRPRVEVVAESAGGLHLVAATALFGFRDDVYVHFIVWSPRQSTLAIYSASRTGYWDLGTNRRRVEDWLSRLPAAVAAQGR